MKSFVSVLLLLAGIFVNHSLSGQLPSFVPTNGLVGWWSMDGNGIDQGPNQLHATVNGALPTHNRFEQPNKALAFNGTSNNLRINSLLDLPQRSINGWMYVSSATSFQSLAFDMDHPDLAHGLIQIKASLNNLNQPQIELADGYEGSQAQLLRYPITLNTWYMVSITRSDSIRYYINGQKLKTVALNNYCSTASQLPQATYFGSRSNNTARFFHGKLDDFGFWNRSLTEGEIIDLFKNMAPLVFSNEKISSGAPFELFPNPANGFIMLQWPSVQIAVKTANISIYGLEGKEVQCPVLNVQADLLQVDTSYLKPGVYFISLLDTHSTAQTKRFVKN